MREVLTKYYLLILFVLISCSGGNEKIDTEQLENSSIEILPEVVFSVAKNDPLNIYLDSRGIVEPEKKIQIIPRISGFVEMNKLFDGQKVNKGDTLVQFDREEWLLNQRESYNSYLAKKNEYEIEIRLRNENLGQEEKELFKITSGLSDAEVAFERAELNLSYATIKAPFSGFISTKEIITNGAYFSAGKPLGVLVNTEVVNIRFDVLETEIVQLKDGMIVELEDPDGVHYEGEITAISPEVSQESKTGQIIVKVDNPDKTLKSGMTVDGRIQIETINGKVKIPRAALLEREGRTLVFKLNSSIVEWIYVTPEAKTSEWVIINHPDVNPGDTLAVDKHFSISHQQRVLPLLIE